MTDGDDGHPVLPESAHDAFLRQDALRKQALIAERKAQLMSALGDDDELKARIAAECDRDPDIQAAALTVLAEKIAASSVNIEKFDPAMAVSKMDAGHVQKAVAEAYDADLKQTPTPATPPNTIDEPMHEAAPAAAKPAVEPQLQAAVASLNRRQANDAQPYRALTETSPGRLSPDQVLASANDPAARAQYNRKEEERGAQQKAGATPAADSGDRKASGNAPAEKRGEMTDAEARKFNQLLDRFTREGFDRAH